MSKKFVRNVTGTNLREENGKVEPFDTNVQNDLLSDETDVYVRQEKSEKINSQYHCLTDSVKEVISNSDLVTTDNFEHGESDQEEKGKSYINVNKATKQQSEQGTSNSSVMTPLQTKYAIDYNNENVIPSLVKEHETPTKITSKSDNLTVNETGKNEFELDMTFKERDYLKNSRKMFLTNAVGTVNNKTDDNNYNINIGKALSTDITTATLGSVDPTEQVNVILNLTSIENYVIYVKLNGISELPPLNYTINSDGNSLVINGELPTVLTTSILKITKITDIIIVDVLYVDSEGEQ